MNVKMKELLQTNPNPVANKAQADEGVQENINGAAAEKVDERVAGEGGGESVPPVNHSLPSTGERKVPDAISINGINLGIKEGTDTSCAISHRLA